MSSRLLEWIYEYRRLKAVAELGDRSLSEPQLERLAALHQLLQAESNDPCRQYVRCSLTMAATLVEGRTAIPVKVIDIGAGGMRVSPAVPLSGDALVRLVDNSGGYVYHYNVSPVGNESGLSFVGSPTQMPLSG